VGEIDGVGVSEEVGVRECVGVNVDVNVGVRVGGTGVLVGVSEFTPLGDSEGDKYISGDENFTLVKAEIVSVGNDCLSIGFLDFPIMKTSKYIITKKRINRPKRIVSLLGFAAFCVFSARPLFSIAVPCRA